MVKMVKNDTPRKNRTPYEKQKLRKGFKRRAAIEPRIGHLKQDHRLGRNFYSGIKGDNINVILAAAAMNLKRIMNKWSRHCGIFLFRFFQTLLHLIKTQYYFQISPLNLNLGF